MSAFEIHTIDNAPPAAADTLKEVKGSFGFIPNLLGALAEAPAALKGYLALAGIFDETSFTPVERQVVLLTANFENGCSYCMAAHSLMAGKQGMPDEVLGALRNGTPIADDRLEALRTFTRSVVEHRGWLQPGDIDAFLAAGYTKAHVLEVVLGVTFKTLSNYANHVIETPLDDAFAPAKWERPTALA